MLLWMHSTNSSPLLSTRVASVLWTLNTLEGSRVTLALSSFPQGWSGLCDRVSGLPISHPGWWQREKSKCKRKRDQCLPVIELLMVYEDLKLLCHAFKEVAPLI